MTTDQGSIITGREAGCADSRRIILSDAWTQARIESGQVEISGAIEADVTKSFNEFIKHLIDCSQEVRKHIYVWSGFLARSKTWQVKSSGRQERFLTWIHEGTYTIVPHVPDRHPVVYVERFSELAKLFAELEQEFDDIPRRITRCGLLEEELSTLEESLEEDEPEYLSWCVSLLRDVFDYNYSEDLNRSHLQIIKRGIKLICQRGSSCNREEYQDLHRELLQTGLSLLPTSDKAREKYKYEENDDEQQPLLFP